MLVPPLLAQIVLRLRLLLVLPAGTSHLRPGKFWTRSSGCPSLDARSDIDWKRRGAVDSPSIFLSLLHLKVQHRYIHIDIYISILFNISRLLIHHCVKAVVRVTRTVIQAKFTSHLTHLQWLICQLQTVPSWMGSKLCLILGVCIFLWESPHPCLISGSFLGLTRSRNFHEQRRSRNKRARAPGANIGWQCHLRPKRLVDCLDFRMYWRTCFLGAKII